MIASTALCTDHYELTMVQAAMASDTANRRCVFELFPRRLPEGRRYGVVAGVQRALDAIEAFRFDDAALDFLTGQQIITVEIAHYLANYRFAGSIRGYAEGEIYFLRGLADPSNNIHLVYSRREDASLTHAWGQAGSWQHEGPNLNAIIASTFDLAWDTDLVFAWGNSAQFGLMRRTGADSWNLTTSPFSTFIAPVNPQLALALGPDPAMVFTEHVDGTFPEINIDYYAIQSASEVWGSAYALDNLNYAGRDLDLVLDPADPTRLWAAYQRGGNNTPERATPMAGECAYAWGNGAGGFALDVLDNGDNAPVSDCGKRVQQALDSNGEPWLAYFDLNSSPTQPLGQLKCAYWTGADWSVETVTTFDLSFQTGSDQFTYGELGLALDGSDRAVIAYLARQTWASQVNLPHDMRCFVWIRELSGTWQKVQLTDSEQVFPRDREPCVLLITPDGDWHVLYVSSQSPDVAPLADKIVHLWRPAP